MDTSINAINAIGNSGTTENAQNAKNKKPESIDTDKMKELVEKNPFDKFDINNDGKISGVEAAKLKLVFHAINFDKDDDDAIDESAFNKALSDYKE